MRLDFHQCLLESTINQNNIVLQDKNGKPIDKSKYKFDFKSRDSYYDSRTNRCAGPIDLILLDKNLTKETTIYKILVQNIINEKGAKLSKPKTYEIKFLETTKPKLVSTNLDTNNKIRGDQVLTLTFSEPLQSPSSNSYDSLELKDANTGKIIKNDRYKLEQDADNPKIIKLSLTDYYKYETISEYPYKYTKKYIKGTTKRYILDFSNLKDLVGNKAYEEGKKSAELQFTFTDVIAPKLIDNNAKNSYHNYTGLRSSKKLVLTFDDKLKASSVTKDNLTLLYEDKKPVEVSKYSVNLDSSDASKAEVYLTDEKLKDKTATYYLKFGNLEDLESNKFVETDDSKDFKLEFIDSVPPKYVSDNLPQNKEISSENELILTFQEKLKRSSVTKKNIILKLGADTISDKYYSVFLKQDASSQTSQVVISLINPPKTDSYSNLKNYKKSNNRFLISINGLSDLQGNTMKQEKSFYFTFLKDTKAPEYEKSNLIDYSKLDSSNVLTLSFDEDLAAESVNSNNFVLQDSSYNNILSNKYKLILDDSEVHLILLDDDLRNSNNQNFRLVIQNIKDEQENTNSTRRIIDFSMEDKYPPRFVGSNIFGDYIFENTQAIKLNFSEAVMDNTVSQIKILKNNVEFTAFSTNLASDKKSLEIRFNNPNELGSNFTQGTNFKIILEPNIVDKSNNKILNPQTLEFNRTITNNQVIFASPMGRSNYSGTSWNYSKDLQSAIDATSTGSKKIVLALQGSYTANSKFTLKNNVKVYGGFNYSDNTRNFDKSILEGDLGSRNQNVIVDCSNSSASETTTLDGFLIQNSKDLAGYGLWPLTTTLGSCFTSKFLLSNLQFKNNIKEIEREPMLILSNLNKLHNVFFNANENKSELGGGAIVIYDSNNAINISNAYFINNYAKNSGGAIYSEASISLDNAKFLSNKATYGGAIYLQKDFKIDNAKFLNNSATYGGAIYQNGNDSSYYPNITIKESTFNKNIANAGGGAIMVTDNYDGFYDRSRSKVKISNSTFYNNKSKLNSGYDDTGGGAIYSNKPVHINSSKFESNFSDKGGALYITTRENLYNINKINYILNSSFIGNSSNFGVFYDDSASSDGYKIVSSTFSNFSDVLYINKYLKKLEVYNSILVNYNKAFYLKPNDSKITLFDIRFSFFESYEITQNADLNENILKDFKKSENQNQIQNTYNRLKIHGGKILDSASQVMIKDKGDNSLYLKTYDEMQGKNGTNTIPATEKDAYNNPRLQGAKIDIGAYEIP